MKITKVSFEELHLQLKKPYTIAYEVVASATNFILKLETDGKYVGYGCAAPDEVVTGETPAMVRQSITDILQHYLLGKNPFHYARVMAELKAMPQVKSSARAMVDMALLDLASKQAGVPLYQFLGGFRDKIETSITIGICSLEETLEEAATFVGQGFRILKIKGGLAVELDMERMHRLKEKYPFIILRFDGNQGYSSEEAIRFFEGTKELGIEIFEQPLRVQQEDKMEALTRRVDIPVMADESLKSLDDTFRLVANDRIDMINIKLMKVGGILEGMHINSVGKANQVEAMVGCIDESALGISAGLHFALSRPNIHFADLDGHLDFLNDPFEGLFHMENGWMWAKERAGLGVD